MPMVIHSIGTAKQSNMNIWGGVVSSEWRTMIVGSEEGDNILRPGQVYIISSSA